MIVPMKRLVLIALKADEQAILQALQRVGAVELIARNDVADGKAGDERLLVQAQRLQSAAQLLKGYGEKPPLLAPKPELSREELFAAMPESVALMEQAEALDKTLAGTRAEIDKQHNIIELLLPWQQLDARMEDIRQTRSVRYATGFLKPAQTARLLESGLAAEVFPGVRENAVVVACLAPDYEAMQSTLKELDFAEFAFPALPGTPLQNIRACEARIAALRGEEEKTVAALQETAKQRVLILEGLDATAVERDRALSMDAVEKTNSVIILEGWVRADEEEAAQAAVAGVSEVFSFETRDPLPEETPPSMLKNSRFVEPFESVVTLYGYPDYRGIDATPAMAPFYFLFFGMMLSDAGYGLVLFLGGLLFTKLLKPQGNMGKLVKVLTYGGLATVFVGPLIGTFFGMNWNDMFNTTIFPLLFDPMVDVMQMMYLSCGLGLVHMFTGIIIRIYMCFRDGDPQSAVFDNLSWLMLLVGILLVALLPALKVAAIVLIALGGGMLLLFSGRSKKNPFLRIGSGLGTLYNISGYLSDTLSYVRIFALGLVSGAMGMVFNLIGGMISDAFGGLGIIGVILGFIVTAAVLVVLHVFNLFINVLGAYAHCARLQFIEFFGKFYDAGGRAFNPLRFNTRNVTIRDK